MIYENVEAIAIKRGISLAEVERKANLSKGAITKRKTASPTIKSLLAVSNVLEVSIEDLTKSEGSEQDAKITAES